MEKGFLTLLLVIFYNIAYSQIYSIAQIDSLVWIIDTSNYKQKTLEATVTTKPGKDKGGSAETYYVDTISKRLMKVELAQALSDRKKHLTSVELTSFYYHGNKLIMVRTSRFSTFGYPNFKKALSSGAYYYHDDFTCNLL
jgi:hypothetical protein